MALRTRVWSAGKLLLLGGALLGTFVLFAAASMRIALRAREVQVPNLSDRTANEAKAIAGRAGLALKVDDVRRPDPKIAAGKVVLQDPPAGTPSRPQRSVRIWLSAGEHAALVPPLTGETDRTAQLRLTQDGLEAPTVSEIRSDVYPSDIEIGRAYV